MNKKIALLLAHLPVWIVAVYIAFIFSSDDIPAGNSDYTLFSTLTFSFWFLASFYAFYLYLVPGYFEKGLKRKFWLYATLFVSIIMPAAELVLIQVTKIAALSLSETFTTAGLLPWAGSILGTAFCGGLGSLYRFLINRFNKLHVREQL